VAVTPATVVLDSVKMGEATPVSWTVTNEFGPVTVTPTGGPLGSAKVDRPTIAHGATQVFTVTVPAGATEFLASIGNPSDKSADLDLEVYRGGVRVGQSADGDSEETVRIANPPAGEYEVRVIGYDVPAGTTEYDYRDVFFASSLGSVSVPSAPLTLAPGESVTVTGTVVANDAPAEGRQLFGEMRLVTEAGAVVGSGAVLIKAVTP
jgi:hypothetical protein